MDIFKISALILVTSFYILYFVKQLILKRQGIPANRLTKGNKPKKTFLIERGLLMTTYSMALVQYASIIFNFSFALPTAFRISGVFLLFISVVLFASAITAMGNSWRAGIDTTQDTKMVTKGIYSISRNPAFAGFDLLYLGTAFIYPNIFTLVGAIIAIIFFHFLILEEEKFLSSAFGQEYIEYKNKVRRYF